MHRVDDVDVGEARSQIAERSDHFQKRRAEISRRCAVTSTIRFPPIRKDRRALRLHLHHVEQRVDHSVPGNRDGPVRDAVAKQILPRALGRREVVGRE